MKRAWHELAAAGLAWLAVGAGAQDVVLDVRSLIAGDVEHAAPRIHLADGTSPRLRLARQSVVSPSTRVVVVEGDQERIVALDPRSYAVYRGELEGYPGSHVVVSITPTRVRGRVEFGPGGGSYDLLAPAAPGDAPMPVTLVASRGFGGVPGVCTLRQAEAIGNETREAIVSNGPASSAAAPSPPSSFRGGEPTLGLKQVEMAIDSDYECYQLFNDEQKTIDYLVEVYGLVSDLTERDLNCRLDVVWMRVFKTPTDPYGTNLGGFPMIPGGVKHDQAQLFSGARGSQAGGGAFVCANGSYIENALGYFGDPLLAHVYNQDLIIPAHELGHCLGSLHTHDYNLDQCQTPGTIPRRGGIISYCYYFNGGYANTDLRYEAKCREVIASCMAQNPAGYAVDCNQNGIEDKADITSGTSLDLNASGVPDECEDCNKNGTLDSVDISTGASKDLDNNKVPDECQPDCNANGIPDALDIKTGLSKDLYQNGVPDECEIDCNANGTSDYTEIQLDMTLDLDRNVVLDDCQDCDGDSVNDIKAINGANACWAVDGASEAIREYHPVSGC